MCDPVSMMAMTAASAGMQAAGAYSESKAARAGHKYNARIADVQAQDALMRGETEVQRQNMRTRQLKGTQRAAMAAAGLDITEGSALNILTDTDVMGDYDAAMLRANAEREASGYRSEANIHRFRAAQERPLVAAATSLLTSSSQVASQWYGYKNSGAMR